MWLPPSHQQREQKQARAQREAQLLAMVDLAGELRHWTEELQQIDHRLQLIKAKDDALPLFGMKAGYYHILRDNPGADPSVIPLENEHTGEFREPGSWMLDMLREQDLWSAQAARDREAKGRRIDAAKERAERRFIDDKTDEVTLRLKAIEQPGVLFSDRPWTWRADAPKEKKAA